MTRPKKLAGKLCYLAPLSVDDAERYATLKCDPIVSIPAGVAHHIGSVSRAKQEIEEMLQKERHIYTVCAGEADDPIGWVALDDIDRINRRARVDFLFDRKTLSVKQVIREAISLLIDYGFNILSLHSILAIQPAWNESALGVLNSIGFCEVCRLRQMRLLAGKYYDELWLDLLESEFDSILVKKLIK